MTDLPFLTTLKPVTREDWLKLVDGVLKGAPYDKKLVSRTYDGLVLDPLPPRKADAAPVFGRTPGAPWTISARVDQADPVAANTQALDDLNGGASGLTLVFASSPHAHGFGLPDGEVLTRVLDSVMLDLIETRVESGRFQGREDALAVAKLVEDLGQSPAGLAISFGLDPLADMAAAGSAPMPWANLSHRFAETFQILSGRGFTSPIARADGAVHHAAGASDAQELAAVIATGVAYLRALEAAGVDLSTAAAGIELALTADVNQFATIAKFRAVRLLWGTVLREAGIAAGPAKVHATTAWRSLTRRDPYVNLLRTTIAAFAAGVGGADSITVLPFTQALGLPDPFARRLARNTQLVLLEESNLHKVSDPGAGSCAVETQTDGLAAAAWDIFRAIERKGGMAEALTLGWWQGEVAAVAAKRAKDVASRKEPVTGTSEYPILIQAVPEVLEAAPLVVAPASDAALVPHRLAEPFELLRDAAEAAGSPKVFLATLGPIAAFTARATYAKNFFEAGGLPAAVPDGYGDLEALLAAFTASGAKLACLASSDELYASDAANAAAALKAAGATVWLAGRPGDLEEPLKAAGVEGFIFAGGDVLETLTRAHTAIGI
ncbi:methylmalonyl-CoA mutase [Aquabacter sp. L1I39]|uniref:methylmalonyl-CoA mutase family protein n=1 Tax=Aquabacter sp. L1I39 TaxID=2820278 RepID=UPI001ADC79C6|nr:methylmalonyl-CoA mutase family protein [Aquabacter sp. L1I39]QTL05492.1 methylmalonyl-CoA mutase [Aquabacter sp. L1I39]